MYISKPNTFVSVAVCALLFAAPVEPVRACGGFFCQLVPINQAGEQIIFRQDGDSVTAVVLIQYAGDAEDFSWVVPVPGIPDLSTGSDLLFAPLELATRPQFVLETTGAACPGEIDFSFLGGVGGRAPADSANEDSGVEILESLAVGPFEVQIVASEDPDALATWLEENEYDLSDRGRELIAPYVEDGMNFVALRLLQDQDVGDIQPLIMRYTSAQPMIPIRLTAVAAQADMGVIVWLLGGSRAVPLNYLHVTPNYTMLNWYNGTQSAYANYQGLITAAMNEAGGQGFATDYAGRDLDVVAALPVVATFTDELVRLAGFDQDAEMIAAVASGFVFAQDKVLAGLQRALPLPEGQGTFIYQVPELLTAAFTSEALATARADILVELDETVIDPLVESLAVFDGDPYMTRLYTTLSPEEMTLDPTFSFNPDLGDQSAERRATLALSCNGIDSRWSLELGPGTGRDGEVVINGFGSPPGFTLPVIAQDSVWRTETVGVAGPPTVVTQKQFAVAQVVGDDASIGAQVCGAGTGVCGAGTASAMLFIMMGLRFARRRRS